jgi:hypothetical protein
MQWQMCDRVGDSVHALPGAGIVASTGTAQTPGTSSYEIEGQTNRWPTIRPMSANTAATCAAVGDPPCV